MRKRKNSSSSSEEEGSEMDTKDEEKVEAKESDSEDVLSEGEDEGEDPELPSSNVVVENPFLDSFYSLSSEDAKVRSKAAQTMLQHCLLSSEANSKDAAYAFRRLLNGVCSGRAAARQGNASALASFLKLAFHLERMEEILGENSLQEVSESNSLLEQVRRRLLAATDPNQVTGKKRGSEERDYHFGRLFGILSIVRSNILITQSCGNNDPEPRDVAAGLVSDLAELFWLKRWMREPAAHGITTLLRTFCGEGLEAEHVEIGKYLVEQVVIPKLLVTTSTGDEGGSDHSSLIGTFCAEQLGIALFIQSCFDTKKLPYPLNKSVLSKETAASTAEAMSETSVVVQPRTHFVWDSLWSYLTMPIQKTGKKAQKVEGMRVFRESCPGGECDPKEVLDLVMKQVVMQRLLRLDPTNGPSGKATHERRALALCVVKIVVGAPFVSSLTGSTRLLFEGDIIESSVLTPEIVRSLFLDVICAGSDKRKTSHILKPLSLETLQEISGTFVNDSSELSDSRRLAVARALMGAEIRFDARTKTSTVSDILGLTRPVAGEQKQMYSFWNRYLEYLQSSLLLHCTHHNENESSSKATGFVELLYGFSKNVLRLETENKEASHELLQFKTSVMEKNLSLFLTAAFFRCEKISAVEGKTPKKKKKGKTPKNTGDNLMFNTAQNVKKTEDDGAGISYAIRAVVSARFFSLLAEYIAYSTHGNADDVEGKIEKDSMTLDILRNICKKWSQLETMGAERYTTSTATPEEKEVDVQEVLKDIDNIVHDLVDDKPKNSQHEIDFSRKRCGTGIAVLAYSLNVHRLSCGEGDEDSDDPDADDENDEEEICSALEGLKEVAKDFTQDSDGDSNPLLGLAEICTNLLSSPIGSGNMGRAASPKLIRDAVKFAWLGGLRLSSTLASKERSYLDGNVINALMQAIGAAQDDETEGEDGEADTDGEDDDESSSSDDSMEENVFTKAIDTGEDPEDMQVENGDKDSDDSDVELDSTKLQTMLEEGSDVDVDEDILEHHEGADAALAKLIRLKQESRKASQQAREKIELSHQLRCTFLLELLVGRFDAWNRVFQTEAIVAMLLPMLKLRTKLERALDKSGAGPGSSKLGANERQALIDRVTALIVQKICKIKVSSLPLAETLPAMQAAEHIERVLEEARRGDSKEHSACCSSCVTFLIRSTTNAESAPEILACCAKIVTEWSTKRTTKLQARMIDDLIVHLPGQSHHLLGEALSKASQNARSPFLKTESFRLLTLLFSSKASASETLTKGTEKSFLAAAVSALDDEEMRKAKRVRVVLKAMEKFVSSFDPPTAPETLTKLEEIQALLVTLGEGQSQGVTAICTKLVGDIEAKVAEWKKALKAKAMAVEETKSPAAGDSEGSKKNKKKKKKKR